MEYLIHLAILISIWSILGVSLNLIVGYSGLMSVTHAAFFGIGAYTTAILMTGYGWNFFLAMLIGIIITMFIAYLFGAILGRFKGDYYALASFGFNIIVFSILLNWQSLTRGPLGIPGIKRPEIFGFEFSSNLYFLVLVIAFAGIIYFLAEYIVKSSFGRVLKAIREDEQAISVFGYNIKIYKMMIFVFSAGMASIAGSLFASYITFIDPSDIAAQMRQVVYGLLLVGLMMYRPQGFMGEYKL